MPSTTLAVYILLSLEFANGLPTLSRRSDNSIASEGASAIQNRGIITDIVKPILPDGGDGPHAKVGQKTGGRIGANISGPIGAEIGRVAIGNVGKLGDTLYPDDPRPAPVTTEDESLVEEGEAAGKYIGGAIGHGLLGETGLEIGELVGETVGEVAGTIAGAKANGVDGLV
ncbi:hypothetical protein C8R43DRAFT_1132747 [Mycena crocata]|nr:hypothetical protein C8R43DRAFT_1132747 [Mycena crocata]